MRSAWYLNDRMRCDRLDQHAMLRTIEIFIMETSAGFVRPSCLRLLGHGILNPFILKLSTNNLSPVFQKQPTENTRTDPTNETMCVGTSVCGITAWTFCSLDLVRKSQLTTRNDIFCELRLGTKFTWIVFGSQTKVVSSSRKNINSQQILMFSVSHICLHSHIYLLRVIFDCKLFFSQARNIIWSDNNGDIGTHDILCSLRWFAKVFQRVSIVWKCRTEKEKEIQIRKLCTLEWICRNVFKTINTCENTKYAMISRGRK